MVFSVKLDKTRLQVLRRRVRLWAEEDIAAIRQALEQIGARRRQAGTAGVSA